MPKNSIPSVKTLIMKLLKTITDLYIEQKKEIKLKKTKFNPLFPTIKI
jgi:hypothetical protein